MTDRELFGGPGCSYCEAAKRILDQHGLCFTERSIDNPEHLAELRQRLPRATSIPQIFVDGQHIGWTEDLEARSTDRRAPFSS